MIDTHTHLYLCKQPLSELVKHAKDAGIEHLINIGINIKTSLDALKQAQEYPNFIHPTLGIHPCDSQYDVDMDSMKQLAIQHPFVAIGEIGLDYHHMTAPRLQQIACFENQLALAAELNLPVVIHNRHADDDIKAIINQWPQLKKVLHCFSSSAAFAESVINETTYFSFTGMITAAKKGKLVNAIQSIPLSHIMIETDCPFLVPIEKKGLENEPAYVGFVAKKIAAIKQLDLKETQDILTQTSKSFFKL